MDAKDLIAQGITLARRGQNEKAREMFNLALITDPRSENAWLWLSTVAVDDAEKEDCLRQVLAINPRNANAANELQKLGEKVDLQAHYGFIFRKPLCRYLERRKWSKMRDVTHFNACGKHRHDSACGQKHRVC